MNGRDVTITGRNLTKGQRLQSDYQICQQLRKNIHLQTHDTRLVVKWERFLNQSFVAVLPGERGAFWEDATVDLFAFFLMNSTNTY